MKTYRHLYGKISAFENLWKAARQARKGKQFLANVAQFEFRLEENLLALERELCTKTYRPGPYRSFFINDPKRRMISAAPYRDRVVHHALMNITAPILERSFIYDSYANRVGKGSHAAIIRYQQYARSFPYVLKCDIRKFFPSMDHEILKREIRWKITCLDTNWLHELIIDNSNLQEPHLAYFAGDHLLTPLRRRKGLPIGNLTSQWWGNVYLNRFDHFVKEVLGAKGYIRYVDDFVLFDHDPARLKGWKNELESYLAELRLSLHTNKTQIYRVASGVPFLGFRVYPQYRKVLPQGTRRYRRFLRKKLSLMAQCRLEPEKLEHGLNSWLGHIRFGQSDRLENRIFSYIRQRGVNLVKHPNGSWRVLEQSSNQLPGCLPQQEPSHQPKQ